MTKPILAIKWQPHGNEAEHLISMVVEHLDTRKKHLKDDTINREIVASLLAQRLGEFTVKLGDLDKAHTEALKAALERLTGPVLTRGTGRYTYALREAYIDPTAQFITADKGDPTKRPVPAIRTRNGLIYRDGTHSEVPFSEIALFGFTKPSLVRVVAPHQHWHMFLDDAPTPSASWKELPESTTPHPKHDELMNLVVDQGISRGVGITRYGEDAFLALNPDAVIFAADNTILRYSGKSGQRVLMNVTDIYGRTHIRWGNKAKGAVAA